MMMSSFEVYLDIRQPAPEAAKPSAGSGAAHMPLRRAVTGQHSRRIVQRGGRRREGFTRSLQYCTLPRRRRSCRRGWWQCRGSFTCGAWRPWTERCATLSTSTSFSGSTTSSGPDRSGAPTLPTPQLCSAASRGVRRSGGMCGGGGAALCLLCLMLLLPLLPASSLLLLQLSQYVKSPILFKKAKLSKYRMLFFYGTAWQQGIYNIDFFCSNIAVVLG